MSTRTGQQRILVILALLLIIFAAPYFVANYFFRHPTHKFSQVNYGQLIQPPLSIKSLLLFTADRQPLSFTTFRGHWTILYFSPHECNQRCQNDLYNIRQVHVALGKDQDRVQRLLLTYPELLKLLPISQLQKASSETVTVTTTPSAITTFLANNLSHTTVLQEGGIFVVDPLGNVILFYPSHGNDQAILKDLTRLLRVSQIG